MSPEPPLTPISSTTSTTVETTTTEAIVNYRESEGQGCCIKPGLGAAVYHRHCACGIDVTVGDCRSLCTKDRDCKGYFLDGYFMDYCNLATTARYCPNNCGNPIHPTHVADLDPRETCNWDAGPCYIKEKN